MHDSNELVVENGQPPPAVHQVHHSRNFDGSFATIAVPLRLRLILIEFVMSFVWVVVVVC